MGNNKVQCCSSDTYHIAERNIFLDDPNIKVIELDELRNKLQHDRKVTSFIKKLILFLVGYCVYIAIEVTYRGVSYPLMGIVSGIAMLLIDRLNDEISWDLDLILQASIFSAMITLLELCIGEFANRTHLIPVMWDYTNLPLNFDGVICLPFSIIWIGLGIVTIFVADAINYYVFEDTCVPYYNVFGIKRAIVFYRKRCSI